MYEAGSLCESVTTTAKRTGLVAVVRPAFISLTASSMAIGQVAFAETPVFDITAPRVMVFVSTTVAGGFPHARINMPRQINNDDLIECYPLRYAALRLRIVASLRRISNGRG